MGADHEIQRIPGVQVAAPIAMVGYLMPQVPVTAGRGRDGPWQAAVPDQRRVGQRRGQRPDPAAAVLRVRHQ
jgi:hypothetical protein